MKSLYRLSIHTYPNGDEHDQSFIGLLRTREEAHRVAARYLSEVPGFRDYYCESQILEIPYLGEGEIPERVWTYSAWNSEEDVLDGWCYPTKEQAAAAMEEAKRDHNRSEWLCECHIVGKLWFEEGFIRDYPSGRIAPTMRELRSGLSACMEPRSICAVDFFYEDDNRYFFPIAVGEQLFYAAEEHDFILNGFTVRRLNDIYEMSSKKGIYQQIYDAEGLTRFDAPAVDISGWRSVFLSLQKLGKDIIVENEYEDGFFRIGRIEEVAEDHMLLRHYDADGIWQEEPARIEYREVTSATFGSRYVEVFSKYVYGNSAAEAALFL